MRRAIIPALPLFLGLFCGCLAARQEQGTQTPPKQALPAKSADGKGGAGTPAGAGDVTDPAAMAGAKPSKGKPVPQGVEPVEKTFIIGAEDVLQIWVQLQQPAQVSVRPDGIISIPLVGDVKASGLTTEELEAAIAKRLKDNEIYNDPTVTVGVVQVRSRKYFISGNVGKTGEVPLVVPTRVSEALANAGGFREWAKITKIRIIRIMPDGTVKKFMYNEKEVSQGKNLKQNILLEPGDHIYVD